MAEYRMRESDDCGLAMTLYNLNRFGVEISYEDLATEWRWPSISWMRNLRDTPGAHWRILRKHNVPWKEVSLEDILGNTCKIENVCVLIHSKDNPDTLLPEGLIYQHWVPLKKIENGLITCDFGDGTEKVWNVGTFTALTLDSFPNCAYEVGAGSTDWNWEMTWDVFMQALPVTITVFSLLVYALLRVFVWNLPVFGGG